MAELGATVPQRAALARILAALAVVMSLTIVPGSASAQDDWSADNRSERQQEVIRRYLDILERRPEQGTILQRAVADMRASGTLSSWIERYGERAARDESNARLSTLHAHLLLAAERNEEAVEAYRSSLERDPSSRVAHQGLGEALAAVQDFEGARASFEEALQLATSDSQRRDLLRLLANLALDDEDYESAAAAYDQLVELDPDDVSLRLEFADALIERQAWERAIAQYDAIITASRYDARQRAEALRDRGRVEYQLGQHDRALETWNEAMQLLEPNYWLHRELEMQVVEAYRALGRVDELIEDYAERRRLTGTQRLLLAQLYEERGDLQAAAATLNAALDEDPRDLNARQSLVRLYDRLGERERAEEELQRALRYDPSNARLASELALRLRRGGDEDGAAEVLERAERSARNSPSALITLSDAWIRLGDEDGALRAAERAVRAEPRNPDWRVALGEVHFIQGRRSTAEDTWREVVELEGSTERGWARYSEVLDAHGLIDEAIVAAERAREESSSAVYALSLAELLERAGRLGEAISVWQTIYDDENAAGFATRARTQLVALYNQLGMLPGQISLWETNAASGEKDRALLATAYEVSGDRDAAIAAWESLRSSPEFGVDALLALSDLYRDARRWSEALAVLEEIVEREPARSRDAWRRASQISLLLDDAESARRFAELGVQANPADARAYIELAQTEFRIGRVRSALETTARALEIDDASDAALELRARLLEIVGDHAAARRTWLRLLGTTRDPSQVGAAGQRALLLSLETEELQALWDEFDERYRARSGEEASLRLLLDWLDRAERVPEGTPERAVLMPALRGGQVLIEALLSDHARLNSRGLRLVSRLCPEGAASVVAGQMLRESISAGEGLELLVGCGYRLEEALLHELADAFYATHAAEVAELTLAHIDTVSTPPSPLVDHARRAAAPPWDPRAGDAAFVVSFYDAELAAELAEALLASSVSEAVVVGALVAGLSAGPSRFVEDLRAIARFGRAHERQEALTTLGYLPGGPAAREFLLSRLVMGGSEERGRALRAALRLSAPEREGGEVLQARFRRALLAARGVGSGDEWDYSSLCDSHAESLSDELVSALRASDEVVASHRFAVEVFAVDSSGTLRSSLFEGVGCADRALATIASAVIAASSERTMGELNAVERAMWASLQRWHETQR